MKFPFISVVVPTLNNEREMVKFIGSIKNQHYPKNRLEIIFADGGSKDKTVEIAKKNKTTVIKNPYVLAEPGVYVAMNAAKGDLLMVLATDNIFYDREAFRKVAEVFENKTVYAALPKQDYSSTDNLFTKYHNTFTDPFNHFIHGYAANARTFHKVYPIITYNDLYDVYDFTASRVIPMISFSQGFTLRKGYKRKKKDIFDDNSPVIDLIESGKKIAYIHNLSLYHPTIKNLKHFIKKQRWATQNFLERKNYGIAHRYAKLAAGQRIRIFIWPIYAFSFILPLIRSVFGVVRDRELLWLFHPINCFICAYANLGQVVEYGKNRVLKKTTNILRQ